MMKLSEAIRLGSMLKPQGFGSFRDTQKTSCAIDAAIEALGLATAGLRFEELVKHYPILKSGGYCCPQCGEEGPLKSMAYVIAEHLNDRHRWSREKIADWVEATFEKQAAPAPEVEACVS